MYKVKNKTIKNGWKKKHRNVNENSMKEIY